MLKNAIETVSEIKNYVYDLLFAAWNKIHWQIDWYLKT